MLPGLERILGRQIKPSGRRKNIPADRWQATNKPERPSPDRGEQLCRRELLLALALGVAQLRRGPAD
jgi:hypothetical protein